MKAGVRVLLRRRILPQLAVWSSRHVCRNCGRRGVPCMLMYVLSLTARTDRVTCQTPHLNMAPIALPTLNKLLQAQDTKATLLAVRSFQKTTRT